MERNALTADAVEAGREGEKTGCECENRLSVRKARVL